MFLTSPSDSLPKMSTVATGISAMEFLYCFVNTSLTQRILDYLLRQMQSQVDAVTVMFLSDRWVLYIKLNSALDAEHCNNCWAFLNENGTPYQPTPTVALALHDLEAAVRLPR
jgi:hypothetical protein